ncbi:MAG: DUF937 domain-containing protein, partial [Gammaproteobacteria bacterium]|nr:DUF937 domain-containing protein [Gammaproteobacteria bacterium]
MATVVNSFIQQHGGEQGVVVQLEKQGLGATVHSWVGSGPNQPIAPPDLEKAIGRDQLDQLAQQTGLSR